MNKKWLIISGICNVIFLVIIGVYLYYDINNKLAKVPEVKKQEMTIVHYPYYIDRTALFNHLVKKEQAIVFLGDSLTDNCEWGELLQNPAIKNRGIAGDTTEGVLNRLDEIIAMKPAKLFLLIGTNDLLYGRSVADTVVSYEKIIERITQTLPKTKIYVQSLPPTSFKLNNYVKSNEEIIDLNQNIKKLANQYHVQYLDLYSVLVAGNGELDGDYTTDGLHLNSKGYERWKEILVNCFE